MAYTPRIVDRQVQDRLAAVGAVVLEGPRACGKTATGRHIAASEVLLDVDQVARETAALDPRLVLEGPVPRLIDEWQLEPTIWNHVRRAIDDRQAAGQFILTGSVLPADDATRHTGAGRLARVRMRPMTLFETGRSTGDISLADLLDGGSAHSPQALLDLTGLAELIALGGWPGLLGRTVEQSSLAVGDYLEELRRVEIPAAVGRRDPQRVGRLLRSLARHTASPAAISTLAADAGDDGGALDRQTVTGYLDVLARLMVVEDQPAWAPHLRSRSTVRTTPKRHFVDPSLAVASLGATPQRLLRDLNLLGLLFESLVVRDLRVYAQAADASVLYYRDNTDLEVDAVVEARDGTWSAFEVKLGGRQVDAGARSLHEFAARVDTSRCGPPAVLGVICATGYGYVRQDGVAVIPIGALGP
jgi:uncharacterized protein